MVVYPPDSRGAAGLVAIVVHADGRHDVPGRTAGFLWPGYQCHRRPGPLVDPSHLAHAGSPGGTIAGHKLPDSFIKEVDGKKQTLTKTDFFTYLSKQTEVDADGNRITGYQKDLANESDDDYLARELITAWLMFTGGTYKDLATMAIKENEVRTLKLKSKENRAHKTVKVTKPASKSSVDDIVLG